MSFAGESPSEIFLICTFQLFLCRRAVRRSGRVRVSPQTCFVPGKQPDR